MAEEDIGQSKMGDIPEDSLVGEQIVSVFPEDSNVYEPKSLLTSELIHEPNMNSVPENSHIDEVNVHNIPKDLFVDEQIVANFHEDPEHEVNGVPKDNSLQTQEAGNDSGVGGAKKWPGWPGENVFRMLVPIQKVGSIIGRKGEYIKKITEETKARIKILDGPPGTSERAVMVSAKEEPDVSIPPAVDGLLRVHKRIVDLDNDPTHATTGARGSVVTRLLVADTQGGSLIGKQGSTIKAIQDASNCTIRVLGAEHLPLCALRDDSVVEVHGEPAAVHKAVELIASHLRKFLVDRSVIGIFEMQMQRPNVQANQNVAPSQSWSIPQGFPMITPTQPSFVPPSQHLQQPRHVDNYYPPPDLPPIDKTHQVQAIYGRDASKGGGLSNVQGQQSTVSKITQHMQIPLSYADPVIGTSGSNISYIRRTSGATIAIQETRGIPGEMTVEINGSAAQVQTAQQLIQNSMAEASNPAQNPTTIPVSQGFTTYPTHAPVYEPSSDASGYMLAGNYGSAYGSSYGY